MVLKPSEVAPLNADLRRDPATRRACRRACSTSSTATASTVGAPLCAHPGRRHGVVHRLHPRRHRGRRSAAPTVKRVDAGARRQVGQHHSRRRRLREGRRAATSRALLGNSGQSCNAPTRMLVRLAHGRGGCRSRQAAPTASRSAIRAPRRTPTSARSSIADAVGQDPAPHREAAFDEGATLDTGGPGRPEGLDTGFYVRPTVFADVTNDMTIAREEIFGPVL